MGVWSRMNAHELARLDRPMPHGCVPMNSGVGTSVRVWLGRRGGGKAGSARVGAGEPPTLICREGLILIMLCCVVRDTECYETAGSSKTA